MAENLSNLEVSTIAIAESVADLKKRTDKFEKGIADSVNALVEESVKSSIKKWGMIIHQCHKILLPALMKKVV